MASIRIDFDIEKSAAQVWDVVGDWLGGPVAMARGFVVSAHADGDLRIVTFADGTVARERLITRDDAARRIVYSLADIQHDNAVMHIVPDGETRCRFLWSRDVLPDAAAEQLLAVMQEAAPIIKETLEN